MHVQDLQQRLDDAERRARERERDRDDEIADLKRRLRDAQSRARQAEPDLDAKQREIDVRANVFTKCLLHFKGMFGNMHPHLFECAGACVLLQIAPK